MPTCLTSSSSLLSLLRLPASVSLRLSSLCALKCQVRLCGLPVARVFFGFFFCILLVDSLPLLCVVVVVVVVVLCCVVLCCAAAAWESGEFACLYFLLLLCLVMSCFIGAHVSDPSLPLSSSQSPPQLSFLFLPPVSAFTHLARNSLDL